MIAARRRGANMLLMEPDLTQSQLGWALRPAASIPKTAVASSLSEVSPVTPAAPIISPSCEIRSTPPGTGTILPPETALRPSMKWGRSFAACSSHRDPIPTANAPKAFPKAISNRNIEEPSCFWKALRCPPSSRIAIERGLSLCAAANSNAVEIISCACASVSLDIGTLSTKLLRRARTAAADGNRWL